MDVTLSRTWIGLGTGIVLLACRLALLGSAGCSTGAQGDRCNPDLSHDECNAGLSCQQPVNCPENYCCPLPDSGEAISSDFCKPGCNGGQLSICVSGGDADCWELDDAGFEGGMCDAEPDDGGKTD